MASKNNENIVVTENEDTAELNRPSNDCNRQKSIFFVVEQQFERYINFIHKNGSYDRTIIKYSIIHPLNGHFLNGGRLLMTLIIKKLAVTFLVFFILCLPFLLINY